MGVGVRQEQAEPASGAPGGSEGQEIGPGAAWPALHHQCLCVHVPDAGGPKLTDLEEQELTKKWQEILGPSNEVMVRLVGGEGVTAGQEGG